MTVTTSMRRAHNLPADFTSFVGRERELPAIKGMLGQARLVTLTGPGGVGKTRLALRAAIDLQRSFQDGVWLVELAGLRDPSLVPQTVTTALGIQGSADTGTLDTLVQFLLPRQLLLVLDNCEHMVDACARLVDTLLRSCPDLRVLATSRQVLRVTGEHVLLVPPLPVPGPDPAQAPDTLGEYAAVRLFAERASSVDTGFTVDAHNQKAVTEICRRLDGIPLAIELAASRLRMLSVHQLHERLDDRYGLLTGGSPAALPRQKTLRALIDWSYELCSPSERLLWSRLAVFADGFELDGAEAVCADDELPAADVFDALAGLVDKSVLSVERHDQRLRYQLSETLREYGRDRLADVDEQLLRRRHRDWCARLVRLAARSWFTSDQVRLFNRLRLEHGNLRSALGFCLDNPGESDVGLRMASLLRFYWLMSGRPAEGRHWLDRLLAQDPGRDRARVAGLLVNGHMAALLSDRVAADSILAEARELAAEVDDPSATAYVTQVRGIAAAFGGDVSGGAELLGEALRQHRALDDRPAMAYDQVQLGLAAIVLGDHDRALELIEDALRTCESAGETWTASLALFALGVAACRQGDHQRAVEAGRRSIELRLALDDRMTIGLSFDLLAWSAAASGDAARAARLLGAAQALHHAIGTSIRTFEHLARLHDEYELITRQALGGAEFERELHVGEELSFEDAADYALGREKPTGQPVAGRDVAVAAGLTPREREIAVLVARGMSNKEIAAALVISQRTAEGHVEHILAKLNFSSRAQVAVWVAENGLLPD